MRLLLALVACKGAPTEPTETDADTDADTDTDTDSDTDADTDTDTDADTDSDTDVDACQDDVHEPNETLQTALAPVPDEDLVVCEASPDFWRLTLEPAQELAVQIAYTGGIADLDLVSSDGHPLATSTTGTGAEQLVWVNATDAATDVIARVRPYGAERVPYTWSHSLQTCEDEVIDGAHAIAGVHPSLPGTEDRWILSDVGLSRYRIDVTWDDGGYDVEVFGAILENSGPGFHTLWVQANASPELTVEQRVGGCGSYSLAWEAETLCGADLLGSAAQPLVGYGYDGTSLTDNDLWDVALAPGQSILVEVVPEAGLVPELYLRGLTGDADPVTSPVLFENLTSEDQVYQLQVALGEGSTVAGCVGYEVFAEAPCVLDDPAEPDDAATVAQSGPFGVLHAGDDTDWVALGTVEAGHSLEVDVRSREPVTADLVTAEGTVLAGFTGANATWTAVDTTEVFARVSASGSACDLRYQVTWE